jgi:ATP-dependent DNA helicase DinG
VTGPQARSISADVHPPRATPVENGAVSSRPAVLVAGIKGAAWLSPDGPIARLTFAEAARRAREAPPMVCHARATARRMGVLPFPALDLLEL